MGSGNGRPSVDSAQCRGPNPRAALRCELVLQGCPTGPWPGRAVHGNDWSSSSKGTDKSLCFTRWATRAALTLTTAGFRQTCSAISRLVPAQPGSSTRFDSVIAAGILTRMIDPAHPHARGRLAGKAQDVASGYRIAELLGQPRHFVGGDRLLHLPLQGRIALYATEKVPELLERQPRLPHACQPTGRQSPTATCWPWLLQTTRSQTAVLR